MSSDDNDYEIIITDGGSEDGTITIAEEICDHIVTSPPGRGHQLNTGADKAKGDLLLFLHADTILPDNFDNLISGNLDESKQFSWGFFKVQLSGKNTIFRLIETLINIRSGLTAVSTGDQCLFMTKKMFDRVNGFSQIAIMEDVDISKRLKAICKPIIISSPVITSSRRWEENGILKTILLMWVLRFLFFIGVSPNTLKSYYN